MANFSIVGLDGVATFTRASAASLVDADGLVQSAASGDLRIDRDPVSGAVLGALIEGSRTNVNPIWTDTSTNNIDSGYLRGNTTRTSANNASPLGAVATLWTASGGNDQHYVVTRRSVLATPWRSVFSLFAKAGTTHRIRVTHVCDTLAKGAVVTVDLTAGTVGTPTGSGSGQPLGVWIRPFRDGWYWIALAVDHLAASDGFQINTTVHLLNAAGADTYTPATTPESVYLTGWQIEHASSPSSPIPTGGSTATRVADVLEIDGADYIAAFAAGDGSILVDYRRPLAADDSHHVATLHDGATDLLELHRDGGTPGTLVWDVTDGGVTQAEISGVYTDAALTRAAAGWAADDFDFAVDGAAAGADTAGSLPAVDRANIGADAAAAQQLGGHIRKLVVVPFRLPSALMEVATA